MTLRHACGYPGCPAITPGDQRYCPTHTRQMEQRRESAYKRGYDRDWQRDRAQELKAEPLCRECLKSGIITVATIRDHIIPHRGDSVLFHDPKNRQSLCKPCHNRKTAKEDGGFGHG